MPKVSVIIPAYNHAPFVGPAIRSVLDQTYQDFEIVITDDGSSDNTVEMIREVSDRRIKLFRFSKKPGRGPRRFETAWTIRSASILPC